LECLTVKVGKKRRERKEARKEEIEEEGRLFDGRFANGGEREREISDGLTVFGYFFSSFFKMAATSGRRSASLSLSTKKRRVHARARVCVG